MSIPVIPWNLGNASESDYNGRVQLCHGGFLSSLFLWERTLRNVDEQLQATLWHKPCSPWSILSHSLVQGQEEQESFQKVSWWDGKSSNLFIYGSSYLPTCIFCLKFNLEWAKQGYPPARTRLKADLRIVKMKIKTWWLLSQPRST